MIKIISIILFGLILCPAHYSQQKTFGYKISGNGDIISDVFLIQEGYVLDSATSNNKTYRFEYYDDGKLKRDINLSTYEYMPGMYGIGCRDYFYNDKGKIDSILYGGKQNDTMKVFDYLGSSIKYSYDNEGRILSKTYTFPDLGKKVEENTYDLYGNLILNKTVSTYSDTISNIREYDSQNRLILTKSIHNSNSSYLQWVYQYDSSGDISCTVQPVGYYDILRNYLFKFDESGKLKNEVHRGLNSTDSTWIENFEILFDYDEYGKIIKMGKYNWFHYNADGNLDTLLNTMVQSKGGYLMNKATLIDSYGNEITFPDYKNYYYFYYSKLITSIKIDEVKNNSFSSSQNYPNPFNPSTTITYSLSINSFITLKIYDLLGREVTTLVNEEKHSGTYKVTWNAENNPSGIYFSKITAGEYSKINKMILLK